MIGDGDPCEWGVILSSGERWYHAPWGPWERRTGSPYLGVHDAGERGSAGRSGWITRLVRWVGRTGSA